MKIFRAGIAVLGLWGLAACVPPGEGLAPRQAQVDATDWSPDPVRLRCGDQSCPPGVGLFVLKTTTPQNTPEIERCTATLVAPDQIMTNAHCEVEFNRGAYFFTLDAQGQTVYRRVLERTYTESHESFELADRDLAFWRLEKPLNEVAPRTVSRHEPNDMSRLVTFAVNEDFDPTAPWGARYVLDRYECTTRAHVALLDAGSDEKSSRLALYNCPVRKGNSGAPLFVPNDLSAVQAVVNTIVNSETNKPSFAKNLSSFFLQTPDYLDRFFAVSERVNCVDLPGFAAPDASCGFPREYRDQLRPALEAILRLNYERTKPEGGILWGARAMSAHVDSLKNGEIAVHQGVTFVPFAICSEGQLDTGAVETRAMDTVIATLDEKNEVDIETAPARELLYHAKADEGGVVHVSVLTDFNKYPFLDRGAPNLESGTRDLKPCTPGALEADLVEAEHALDRARYPGSEDKRRIF